MSEGKINWKITLDFYFAHILAIIENVTWKNFHCEFFMEDFKREILGNVYKVALKMIETTY